MQVFCSYLRSFEQAFNNRIANSKKADETALSGHRPTFDQIILSSLFCLIIFFHRNAQSLTCRF